MSAAEVTALLHQVSGLSKLSVDWEVRSNWSKVEIQVIKEAARNSNVELLPSCVSHLHRLHEREFGDSAGADYFAAIAAGGNGCDWEGRHPDSDDDGVRD